MFGRITSHRLQKAYASIFDAPLAESAEERDLKARRFSEFKKQLGKLSSAE